MDGLESIILSEIHARERHIPHDFTHVEFKKQNKQRKKRDKKKNPLKYTEQNGGYQKGDRWGGMGEIGEGD